MDRVDRVDSDVLSVPTVQLSNCPMPISNRVVPRLQRARSRALAIIDVKMTGSRVQFQGIVVTPVHMQQSAAKVQLPERPYACRSMSHGQGGTCKSLI